MKRHKWLGEFIMAATLAWIRVGYEVMNLIVYAMKRNDPTHVKDSERRNENGK